jgi:uncharacterized protein (TIGR02300 family)
VAKPEWGTKRICQSCSAPFYDLRRDPILCPKCGAVFDPEAILKSRKVKGVEETVEPPKKKAAEPEEAVDDEEESLGEEDDVLEDASDLDDDDMSGVIEASEDDDET